MNDKITTAIGQEMLESVTPIYNNDDYALSIFEANGKVMDDLQVIVKQTRDQMYPQKATWSLGYWEEKLGIKDMKRKPDEERVHRVLFELNKYFSITRYRMETIVNNFVEMKSAKVEEEDGEYAFRIIIPAEHKVGKGLRESVEEVKPAHLLAIYEMVASAGAIIILDDSYHYPVYYKSCGTFSGEKEFGQYDIGEVLLKNDTYDYIVEYPVAEKEFLQTDLMPIELENDTYDYIKRFPVAGEMELLTKEVTALSGGSFVDSAPYEYNVTHPICGEFYAEGE